MKVGEIKQILDKFDDNQEVVFAQMNQGYNCDVFSWIGCPTLKNEFDDEDIKNINGISELPDNAIIFDITY